MFKPFQIQVAAASGNIKISAWSTGAFQMDTDLLDATSNSVFISRLKAIFSGKTKSGWLPYTIWLVDHPMGGLFLIDTGSTARSNEKAYKRKSLGWLKAPFSGFFSTSDVKRTDEADFALEYFGYQKSDLKFILLTHLHFDHLGGLYHFPEQPVLVHEKEWKHPHFFKKELFEPKGRNPRLVQLGSAQVPSLGNAYDLTNTNDFLMVETPGHTLGHVSFLVRGHDQHYLLAGDLAYYRAQIDQNSVGVLASDFELNRKTYQAIRDYPFPLNVLCTHDPKVFGE